MWPRGFQEYRLPDFHDIRHMKVVRSSAQRTGRLYHQKCSQCSFSLGAESTPGPRCGPIFRNILKLNNVQHTFLTKCGQTKALCRPHGADSPASQGGNQTHTITKFVLVFSPTEFRFSDKRQYSGSPLRNLEVNLLVIVKRVPITWSLGPRPIVNANGVHKKWH